MTELAKVVAQERALMDKSRELLSTVAAMHVSAPANSSRFKLAVLYNCFLTSDVLAFGIELLKQVKQCSLLGHIIQLSQRPRMVQI